LVKGAGFPCEFVGGFVALEVAVAWDVDEVASGDKFEELSNVVNEWVGAGG